MSTDIVLITALIKPHLEGRVIHALHDLPHFPGFTLTETRGQGRGRGAGGSYQASEHDLVYQRQIQLQIVCPAQDAPAITDAIRTAAWTGQRGDGVIFTLPVADFTRIREAGSASQTEGHR